MNRKPKKICQCALLILFLHILIMNMLPAQNTSFPVGAIPGVIDVSPMGAATYTIPIEVVPGTQGMQPNLSIVYNSFGGMGLLGMKWNLAGLSAITRCGQIPYFDNNKMETVLFNFNDRFALDGGRLIQIGNGCYGGDGVRYATEVENFTRVVSVGGGTTGPPDYFVAYTDDGTIIEYGNTTGNTSNSKQNLITDSSTITLSWYINKITDANGNFMTFYYEDFTDGEIWIKEIHYTGNDAAGITPYTKVIFGYDTTSLLSQSTFFLRGYSMPLQSQILKNITITYNNTIVCKYEFMYNVNDSDERTVHLKKIILSDENNTKLNGTTIDWGENNISLKQKSMTGLPTNFPSKKILTGDFDGDGYSDILAYDITAKGKGLRIYLYEPETKKYTLKISLDNFTYEPNMLYIQDINGDGKDELITTVKEESDVGSLNYFTFYTLINNSLTGLKTLLVINVDYITFGDFDGDYKIEIMFRTQEKAGTLLKPRTIWTHKFYKWTGNGFLYFDYIRTKEILSVNSAIIDANGNGKKNIQIKDYDNNTTTIYEFNGTIFQPIFDTPNHHSYTWKYYGDVNGDGITDVLAYCLHETLIPHYEWRLFIGKGGGTFIEKTLDEDILNAENNGNYYEPKYPCIMFVDIDGDGKEDIIQGVCNKSNGKTTFNILLSKGYENGKYNYTKKTLEFNGKYDLRGFWFIDDFDGDGKREIVLIDTTNLTIPPKIIYVERDANYEFVKEIEDGMGKRIQLGYNHKYFIEQGSRQKYFLSVPEYLKVSNGIGTGLNMLQYQYNDPDFSLSKRAFLGFLDFICINSIENIKDVFWFTIDKTKQFVIPLREMSFNGNEKISERIYTVELQNLTSKRFAINYSITEEYDKLSLTAAITCNYLSPAGRLVESFTQTYNKFFTDNGFYIQNYNAWLHKSTTTYYYKGICFSNSNQKKTVPLKVINTQQYGTRSPIITDTVFYNYDRDGHLTQIKNTHADGAFTTSYSNYTPTGSVGKKVVSAPGCDSRTETYTYDNTGRFVTSIKNPDFSKFETTFTYDPKTGNKLSETDLNELTTTYKYDTFGNLIKITEPDGTETNTTVSWHTSPYIPNVCYKTYTTTTGKPSLTVYYDMLGREVCRLFKNYYTDTRFNAKGQVVKTSLPYSSINLLDAKKIWNEFTYDKYGREDTVRAPYTHLTYSYSSRKVTVKDNLRGVTSIKECDALGRVVLAKDTGGTITYKYEVITDSNKKPRHKTTITSNGETTITISDLLGNRLSIIEPNAGEIKSEYNGFNELLKQTDARGNITTYQYDKLGRITQKKFTDAQAQAQTIKYYYDPGLKGSRGKLYKIDLSAGNYETFNYNILGRLQSHTKRIDGSAFMFSYSYTPNGQLETLTYPGGFSVKYSYNATGELNEIKNNSNGALIYKAGTRNKFNALTYCEYGNGTATQYSYNDFGLITRIKTGNKTYSSQGDTTITIEEPNNVRDIISTYTVDSAFLNYRYGYDNKGLMTYRSESVINRAEQYQYDQLDRLTKFTYGTIGQLKPPEQTFMYAPNGNISATSQWGNYTYGNKPHAVAEISPNVNSSTPCAVVYNYFNQPTNIDNGIYRLELTYGANRQRTKAVRYKLKGNTVENTRYYINKQYEKEIDANGVARHFHYIYGDYGVVALHIETISSDTTGGGGGGGETRWLSEVEAADGIYYIYTDHLGSYCAITSASKQVMQRNFFDPWGNSIALLRGLPPDDPQAQEQPTLNFTLTSRGFTGHEHYSCFKIINMNGRLYDPVIGRFFSPDKYVANSSFTQDFNRYSYARNCPLMYTDPSGEIAWFIPLIYIGVVAAINVATNMDVIIQTSHEKGGWAAFGKAMGYFGLGAIDGAVSWYCPALSPIVGFGTGIVNQGLSKGFKNINYEQQFVSAAISLATTSLSNFAFNKALGNVDFFKTTLGGNIIKGVITNNVATLGTNLIMSRIYTGSFKYGWEHYLKTGWWQATLRGGADGAKTHCQTNSKSPDDQLIKHYKERLLKDKDFRKDFSKMLKNDDLGFFSKADRFELNMYRFNMYFSHPFSFIDRKPNPKLIIDATVDPAIFEPKIVIPPTNHIWE